MLDIRKFCAVNDPRDYLKAPFEYRGRLCATKGHIMAFLPTIPPEFEGAPQPHKMMPETLDKLFAKATLAAYAPLPAYVLPEPKPCIVCEGTKLGKITTCPECDGDGYVVLENDYNEYDCDCKSCYGDGREYAKSTNPDDTCPQCNGLGSEWALTDHVGIAGRNIAARYAAMLQQFAGLEVEQDKREAMDALSLRQVIDGKVEAYIVVMPMRV